LIQAYSVPNTRQAAPEFARELWPSVRGDASWNPQISEYGIHENLGQFRGVSVITDWDVARHLRASVHDDEDGIIGLALEPVVFQDIYDPVFKPFFLRVSGQNAYDPSIKLSC
jgi:hypothetical protein